MYTEIYIFRILCLLAHEKFSIRLWYFILFYCVSKTNSFRSGYFIDRSVILNHKQYQCQSSAQRFFSFHRKFRECKQKRLSQEKNECFVNIRIGCCHKSMQTIRIHKHQQFEPLLYLSVCLFCVCVYTIQKAGHNKLRRNIIKTLKFCAYAVSFILFQLIHSCFFFVRLILSFIRVVCFAFIILFLRWLYNKSAQVNKQMIIFHNKKKKNTPPRSS